MFLFLACAESPDSADSAALDPGPVTDRFSFVVFADPHVTEEGDHADRLRAAVQWVNDNATGTADPGDEIAMVVIVGDIGWSGGEELAAEILGGLSVPWVPIVGDNEIQYGSEESFDAVMSGQYAALADTFSGWDRAATPVDNPQVGGRSWFQDFSFELQGLHVVGLDWCSRVLGGLEGEMADLHDFEGGSWPWFSSDLEGLGTGPTDRVILFSHHAMHLSPGAFDLAEMEQLDGLLSTWDDAVFANFAGHYHVSGEEDDPARPINVYVTDAIWDDVNTIRLVQVSAHDAAFFYEQSLVELP